LALIIAQTNPTAGYGTSAFSNENSKTMPCALNRIFALLVSFRLRSLPLWTQRHRPVSKCLEQQDNKLPFCRSLGNLVFFTCDSLASFLSFLNALQELLARVHELPFRTPITARQNINAYVSNFTVLIGMPEIDLVYTLLGNIGNLEVKIFRHHGN
jgi:hypothetical protein